MRESRMADGATRLALLGELDLSSVQQLTARLSQLRDAGMAVRLDLSALEFLDSTGIAAILGALRHAQLEGRDLSVMNDLMPRVRRVMTLTGLDQVLWPPAPGQLAQGCADGSG